MNRHILPLLAAFTLASTAACSQDKAIVVHDGTCTANDQCPNGAECMDGVCYLETLVGCDEQSDCPSGSQCLDNGVCYQMVPVDNHECGAQIGGPMYAPTVKMPAPKVELLHIKAFRVPGANACTPTISHFTYELDTTWVDGGFVPHIEMEINGQMAALINTNGGSLTDQWHWLSYDWQGMIFPTTNIGGESIRILCTNCDDEMPQGVDIFMQLTSWWWNNNPGEPVVFEIRHNFGHVTIFP